MSKHLCTKARWMVLATLSVFAAVTPQASADTSLPTWTCRGSAAYVELNPLLQEQRVEPVLANGFADRNNPDTDFCANADTGVNDVLLPVTANIPLLTLQGAFASTSISPSFAAARDQTVTAEGGVLQPLRITLAGLDIIANAVTSEASATCVAGVPTMTGQSTIVSLSVNGTVIEIPANGAPLDINLLPLIRVRLNQQVVTGNALSADQSLTQRAAHIELLAADITEPVARVVIGESKVDRHGAVCAAAPPPPTCPAGSIAQDPNATPLVCVLTVTPPCPAGSTANGQGACIVTVSPPCGAGTMPSGGTCIATPVTCPAGTVKEPTSGACVLVVQRPCPTGATPDPATRVCVLRVAGTNTNTVSGENGRIGNPNGPVATCGRLSMRFVRGKRNLGTRFTSRFGNRTVTRGRLVTCGSNPRPIVRARIDVVHVFGGKRRIKTGLRSRLDGLLTLILPIDLRTRNIEYSYRPNLNTRRVTSRVTLRLTVKNKAGRTLR